MNFNFELFRADGSTRLCRKVWLAAARFLREDIRADVQPTCA
jgi:hypothetical protein